MPPKLKSDRKKGAAAATKKVELKPAPKKISLLSKEYVEDVDDDEESEQTSGGLNSDASTPKTEPTSPRTSGDDESGSAEETSSDEAEDEVEGEVARKGVGTATISDASKHTSVEGRAKKVDVVATPARPVLFTPPIGYRKGSIEDGSDFTDPFGDEVVLLHVEVPAHLQQAFLQQRRGLIDVGGFQCKLVEVVSKQTDNPFVLLPDASKNGYSLDKRTISQRVRLGPDIPDPTVMAAGRATIPSTKPVRKQPSDLRMRHEAIGTRGTKRKARATSEEVRESVEALSETISDGEARRAESKRLLKNHSSRKSKEKARKAKKADEDVA